MVNKIKGNMYAHLGLTGTWNPIKGKCPHECTYCYMNKINNWTGKQDMPVYLDEKCLKDNLGSNKCMFIGSSCDMWAKDISDEWINRILEYLDKYPESKYLFQTKDMRKIEKYSFQNNYVVGTTIETNYSNRAFICMGKAPNTLSRAYGIGEVKDRNPDIKTFITIEPILDFDLDKFVEMLRFPYPDFINMGADSGNNYLPEPPKEKILELITELERFTKVNLKDNLKRLLR